MHDSLPVENSEFSLSAPENPGRSHPIRPVSPDWSDRCRTVPSNRTVPRYRTVPSARSGPLYRTVPQGIGPAALGARRPRGSHVRIRQWGTLNRMARVSHGCQGPGVGKEAVQRPARGPGSDPRGPVRRGPRSARGGLQISPPQRPAQRPARGLESDPCRGLESDPWRSLAGPP
jgi:hypothetical protein